MPLIHIPNTGVAMRADNRSGRIRVENYDAELGGVPDKAIYIEAGEADAVASYLHYVAEHGHLPEFILPDMNNLPGMPEPDYTGATVVIHIPDEVAYHRMPAKWFTTTIWGYLKRALIDHLQLEFPGADFSLYHHSSMGVVRCSSSHDDLKPSKAAKFVEETIQDFWDTYYNMPRKKDEG